MIVYAISCILLLYSVFAVPSDPFAVQVANRCKGEASFAIPECACTVKNRLDAGWNRSKVLKHYFAADVKATNEEVAVVDNIITGNVYCDNDYYYMFSDSDKGYLGLSETNLETVVKGNSRNIWIYNKSALQKRDIQQNSRHQ